MPCGSEGLKSDFGRGGQLSAALTGPSAERSASRSALKLDMVGVATGSCCGLQLKFQLEGVELFQTHTVYRELHITDGCWTIRLGYMACTGMDTVCVEARAGFRFRLQCKMQIQLLIEFKASMHK